MSSSLSVLVIDANPFRAKMIKGWLSGSYTVTCRTTVTAGEDYLKRFSPVFIISYESLSLISDIPTFIIGKDFLEPLSEKEIVETVDMHALPYAKLQELRNEKDKLETENEQLKKRVTSQTAYLKKAGEVQRGMLKKKQYDKVKIATQFLPLLDLSGDFYYYKRFEERLYFMIGDVVDHGAEAAIYMTELTSFLYALLQNEKPLPELLYEFNRLGRYYNHCVLSATVFAGTLNLDTGELEYCSIGHELPFVVGEEGVRELAQENTYLPVGFNETDEFETHHTHLSIGDKLFMFTDGLTEEFNSMGANADYEYGDAHLLPILEKNKNADADTLCENVLDDMQNFIAGNERNDDILIFCIERTGV